MTNSQENVAGVACQHIYKPNVPSGEYPVPNARPVSSMVNLIRVQESLADNNLQDMDLMGLENDPDFWITTLDSDSPKRGFPDTTKGEQNLEKIRYIASQN